MSILRLATIALKKKTSVNTKSQLQETALKAKDILKATFPTDKRTSVYVAPAKLGTTSLGYVITTVTKMPRSKARLHRVLINLPKNYQGKFNACDSVKIDCTCARYLYVWNFALKKANAAIKDRTNGQPPVDTNPRQAPGACKHALIALAALTKMNPTWPENKATIGKTAGRRVTLLSLKDARRT